MAVIEYCVTDLVASKRLLRGRAERAIDIACDGEYDGMCDPVCVEFCRLVERLGLQTEGLASVRFLGLEPHYVAVLSGDEVDFSTAEYVIVDPTIKQFSELLDSPVEEVEFVDSDDGRWDEWYYGLEFVSDRRVAEFREEQS